MIAREQRAERELVEEDAHLLLVERALAQLAGLHADVDVAAQQRHRAVQQHPIRGLGEVLTLLRRQLVDVLEDALEGAVGADELRRRLLADAGHAGQVVARVTAQRRVLRVLRRA